MSRSPRAPSTACPTSAPTRDDSEELSRFLLDKALVVTVPGKEFGAEGHLRLSYCGTRQGRDRGHPRASAGRSTRPRRTRSRSATAATSGTGCDVNLLDVKTPAQAQAGELRERLRPRRTTGSSNPRCVYWNLPVEALVEEIVFRGEGRIVAGGAVAIDTGKHTSRAAQDKFIVREPSSEEHVWWGEYNRPLGAGKFDDLQRGMLGFLQGRDLFVQDSRRVRGAGVPAADPRSSPSAPGTASSPGTCSSRRRTATRTAARARVHVSSAPSFRASGPIDGTRSETVHRARLRAAPLPDRRHRATRAR